MRRLKAVALGLSISLGATVARSASGPGEARVALVTADAQSTTTTRLKAELEQLGVSVAVIVAGEETPVGRVSLENIARTAGAFAAVRVVPVAAEVEVWVADRVTGKTVVREVIRGRESSARMDDTIALGAVELLRASLLEVTATPELQHGEVEPPPVVRAIAPAPEPSPRARRPLPPLVALSFEPTMVVGFDGPLAALNAGVGARARGLGPVWLEGWTQLPILPATLRQIPTGKADVSATWVGLGLAVWGNASSFAPAAGAGIAGALLEVDGREPRPGYAANREVLRVAAPYLRASLAIRLLEQLRLRADATALYAVRGVPIRFVGEEQASWGRPSLLVGAGLEVLLPRE